MRSFFVYQNKNHDSQTAGNVFDVIQDEQGHALNSELVYSSENPVLSPILMHSEPQSHSSYQWNQVQKFPDQSHLNFGNNTLEEKKKYSVTSDSQRLRFMNILSQGDTTIKEAAKKCDINYSTAKSIVKLMKDQGRILKKKHRKTSICSTPLNNNKHKLRMTRYKSKKDIAAILLTLKFKLYKNNRIRNLALQRSIDRDTIFSHLIEKVMAEDTGLK
ncbi:UNKNOWN [Stylonychia lemnae]|uniref:Uncharacterized protein n=1 Tax=Stylonychia lemnae TaxID=5949 RepID=A0A078APF9_STYLE|nr:UNKNOWN [Stylonychia lemnae]|eukprot:CDW83836.1 UNKNOWN [Stylonychia lemnae]